MRGAPQVSAATLGFRRVSWVRVVLGPAGARCQVVGTVHRGTTTRAVPLRTAVALLAAGVPGVVRPAPAPAPARVPPPAPVQVGG